MARAANVRLMIFEDDLLGDRDIPVIRSTRPSTASNNKVGVAARGTSKNSLTLAMSRMRLEGNGAPARPIVGRHTSFLDLRT